MLRWLMLLSAVISAHLSSTVAGKKIIYFDSYSNCKEKTDDYAIVAKDVSIGMRSYDSSEVNLTWVITKDLGSLKLIVEVYNCGTSGGLHCERVMNVPVNDACNKLLEKNAFWSSFAVNMQPPLTCPFKKGAYRTRLSIDPRLAENFAVPNVFYKQVFSLRDRKNEEVGCTLVGTRFIEVKSKKKKSPST